MLNESSLLLEKQIYLMLLNWNLTSLSFCDLPVTFTYRDWNELALRWWNHLSHSNHIFQDEKKKPREHKSQTTQMLKPISGQFSLSLPFENDRKSLVNHCFLNIGQKWIDYLKKEIKKESTCMQHGINLQNVTWTGAKNNTLTIFLS